MYNKGMMKHPNLSKVAQYELLKPEHVSSTIDMFMRAFCLSEPMTKYVDMQFEEFRPFATMVTEKAARDGLSTVVLDGNKVIACTLVEDIANPLDIKCELTKKFDPIFNLLDNLSAGYFAGKIFSPHLIAHLFITAVHEDYRGMRLSEIVNFGAMEVARRAGFHFMFSELTNYINENGLVKYLEFEKKLLGVTVYRDFQFDGRKPFSMLAGEAHSYLWELYHDDKISLEDLHK